MSDRSDRPLPPLPSASTFLERLAAERERAGQPGNGGRARRRTSSTREPGRPVDADAATTRANIMAAALSCFGRSGFDRTTNNQIAGEAGISSPTLYHYFDSKAALFQAVADETHQQLFGRIDRRIATCNTTAQRIAAVVEVIGSMIEETPDTASFIATYAAEARRNPDVLRLSPRELWTGPIGFYTELIAYGQDAGDVVGDVESSDVAVTVVALVYGISLLIAVAPQPEIASRVARVLERIVMEDLFVEPPHER